MIKSITKQQQTNRKWVEVDGKDKWRGAESDLQRQCDEYLEYLPDVVVIRFPDAAYRAIFASRNIPEHVKRIIADYVRGIPDLILLKDRGDKVEALAVELKTATGKLSQGQKNFGNKVKVNVIRDFNTFVDVVNKFRE